MVNFSFALEGFGPIIEVKSLESVKVTPPLKTILASPTTLEMFGIFEIYIIFRALWNF